jgi:hypothetical protein
MSRVAAHGSPASCGKGAVFSAIFAGKRLRYIRRERRDFF